MFEILKEKMRNSLKEMEEKTKKWKTSTNPLKKTKKKQSNICKKLFKPEKLKYTQ